MIFDLNDVKFAIDSSTSIKEVLIKLRLPTYGKMYKKLRTYCEDNNIVIPKSKGKFVEKRSIESYLVLGSCIGSSRLKSLLIKNGYLLNVCYLCDQEGTWKGSPLSLQLDHINGISNDNRLSNLRVLCPNCHSQTDTYAGKRNKVSLLNMCPKKCLMCSRVATKGKSLCKSCVHKGNKELSRKFNPSMAELSELVWKMPTTKVAELFGVSDKAVEKRCKLLGICKPPRGYWSKFIK